jgi:C-terminal processing protease CtpA/Prc
VAKLKAGARVDSRVYLKRTYSKEKWGINLTYTFSKNHGLHLIMKDVVEGCPAWESGVRPGDVIVTVNDWLIVLMDRPQVAAHLFQAGANIVKLGIQKSRGTSPEKYLGLY